VTVPAETLNHGKQIYSRYCAGCHGSKGDGMGGAATSMSPAPRNFILGHFKYTSVPDGGLPTDQDLERVVRRGLPGTHMPAWGRISEQDATAVAQYIKTFSPRWSRESQPQPLEIPADPWADRREAAERGRALYHTQGECWTCHPSYAPAREIVAMTAAAGRELGREPEPIAWRGSAELPRKVNTSYGVETPPDFLQDKLRCDERDQDVYRSIAAGIGGTPMPSAVVRLRPSDIWALVHYVRDLQRLRGTPEAQHLRQQAASGPHAPPAGPAASGR
jgi:mono/diheme cytochrome c family protein